MGNKALAYQKPITLKPHLKMNVFFHLYKRNLTLLGIEKLIRYRFEKKMPENSLEPKDLATRGDNFVKLIQNVGFEKLKIFKTC